MATEISARVELQEKLRFVGYGHGGQGVAIDYPPPLGDDTGLRGGLQLLLMALAACMGQTVLPILRKMQQQVTGCTVEAHGMRRDEHPTILTQIRLVFIFRGTGLQLSAVQKAVGLGGSQYCPVHAMLRESTPITMEIRLVDERPRSQPS